MSDSKSKSRPAQVIIYSYPKLIFAWPLVIFGFFFAPFAASNESAFIGWMYLFTMLIVLLTIGVDVERNYTVFWTVVVLLLLFIGMWIGSYFEIKIFQKVVGFFGGFGVKYNRGFGLALSILLLVPFIVMVFWSRVQHKWRITHNEFESYSFGRADDSLARGAKRVRSTYPDILELILCGAGTLIVYSATGRQELRRIPNVPLLPLKRRKINAILETTSVTTTDSIIEEEFAAEQEEEIGSAGEDEIGTPDESGGTEEGGEIGDEPL